MNKTDKEFTHFQFKIKRVLWDKFKIKVIRDGCPTYREKIEELIEGYVHTCKLKEPASK
jgi:hypothetical protein